ncbi:MAG: lipoyl synthase [Actinomycetota bacterium]
MTLQVRWLGSVPYAEALDLQRALHGTSPADHLLLLEHTHVYTLGVRADLANVLVRPADVGAELVRADRGGDVTYHGPGQLVGYPILTLPGKRGGGMADTVEYVTAVEQLLIDALAELGLPGAGRLDRYPGVWVDPDGDRPRKIAAIGVRLTRGRTMHGFALNVAPDLDMFGHIVPCGIDDKPVTSLAAEGLDVEMRQVVDVVSRLAGERWGGGAIERHDVVWKHRASDLSPFSRGRGSGEVVKDHGAGNVRLTGRLAQAGVTEGLQIATRKPEWLRVKAKMGSEYLQLKRVMRDLDLRTVCEEASCPNIFECWEDGTATFMINGERCTRACGFCDVDTRRPEPLDPDEPERVAEAVSRMGLAHAVVTAVARDDLDDGGAAAFAETIHAIRRRTPGAKVEVLIPDFRGDADQLRIVLDARPDVLNHNVESVPRLQRAVRPSAGYARSLAVLARGAAAGLVTKTSIIVGMGETDDEVLATLTDLRGVGCDIVTIGQYLRPTTNHLPVHRWVEPAAFERFRAHGMDVLGIPHVESGPLTRSSYHARESAERATSPSAATA